jgi:hypothetical protein
MTDIFLFWPGKESVVPHMCKKIARMPNMNSISSKAMLVKMLAEKNRYIYCTVVENNDIKLSLF